MQFFIRYILLASLLAGFAVPLQALPPHTSEPDSEVTLSLNVRNQTYEHLLLLIEKESGYRFSYRSDLFDAFPATNLWVKEAPLREVLEQLLSPLSIEYKIGKKMIVLRKKERSVTISGFVREQGSDKALPGASVYSLEKRAGAASNQHGFFSISIQRGESRIHCSFIGYEPQHFHFASLQKDTTLIIELMPDTTSLKEVVIEASSYPGKQTVSNSQMGKISFTKQTIRQTPVLFGEADLIKTLQLTPGVAAGTEGIAGLYVRGGNLDENLFLIDGNPVYQVNHVGGIFSAFNPEAINDMEFLKGGFPSRFGGRLSSVVDIRTNEGNMQHYHGSISLGLIAGNLSIEGPIRKDKTSFHLALRRTWLDVLTAPAMAIVNRVNKKKGHKFMTRYAFHDLNGKVTHRFNEKSRGFISIYNGNDALEAGYADFNTAHQSPYREENTATMRWGNLMATAGWTYMFNHRLFGKISAIYTRYHSRLNYDQYASSGVAGDADFEKETNGHMSVNGIQDMGIRSLFNYQPNHKHHIRFGGDFLFHIFKPEYTRFKDQAQGAQHPQGGTQLLTSDRLNGGECALFAEDDWDILPTLRVNGGVRFSTFSTRHKTYASIEPRASVRWLLSESLSIKGSYARMAQYVHQLSNSYLNLPTDSWMPVTDRLKPLLSDQLSAGIYYQFHKDYSFSVEGYYKTLHNLLDYKDGYSFMPGTSEWEDKLAVGKGHAYGMEWMIRKESGRTTGWIGYTLSWANRRFEEINEGKAFPSRFDNRHKFNVVVTQKLGARVDATVAWSFNSGNYTTLPLERYVSAGQPGDELPEHLEVVPERNNFQLPAYHRLDLSLNIYKPKKKNRMGIWNISVYNAYNRLNPFMVYQSSKTVGSLTIPKFKLVGVMPLIPSVSYTYKF